MSLIIFIISFIPPSKTTVVRIIPFSLALINYYISIAPYQTFLSQTLIQLSLFILHYTYPVSILICLTKLLQLFILCIYLCSTNIQRHISILVVTMTFHMFHLILSTLSTISFISLSFFFQSDPRISHFFHTHIYLSFLHQSRFIYPIDFFYHISLIYLSLFLQLILCVSLLSHTHQRCIYLSLLH